MTPKTKQPTSGTVRTSCTNQPLTSSAPIIVTNRQEWNAELKKLKAQDTFKPVHLVSYRHHRTCEPAYRLDAIRRGDLYV